MQIYLPIAEMSVNIFALLALGGVAGILSGLFGVGGGFLMTPLLIFIGIPPAVAVASSANQIIAASFSGFLAHWRKNNVDFRMGMLLLVGGYFGSNLGVWIFHQLQAIGQIDLVISLCYVLLLGSIGAIMAVESGKTLIKEYRAAGSADNSVYTPYSPPRERWIDRLPFKMYFPRSSLEVSGLLPLGIGFFVGILVSLMGVGGGFFMIPAMIYLLGMPTSVVVGTSLFQIMFITANVTFLQAITTQTVDIVLALILLSGAVVGAQYGSQLGARIPAVKLRALLALMVLCVALKLAIDLFTTPDDVFSITIQAR
jgi:uncharacterized membrane protein YfcA